MKNETGRNDFKVWKMWLNKKQLKLSPSRES
jgi:hypothetical protein